MKSGFEEFIRRVTEFQQKVDFLNKALGNPPFEEVTPEMNGPCVFGYGENGLPFSLQNLTRSILINGDPGSGKTTAIARFIIHGIGGAKVIAMDSMKHDYRHIKRYVERTLILSYELGTHRDNYLQPPPGLTDDEFDPILIEAYGQPFKVPGGAGSEQYAYIALKELKREVKPRIPSLADYYEYILEKNELRGTENYRYRERNLIRLRSILEDHKDVINCSEGYPIDYLIDGDFHFVVELPSKADMAGLAGDILIFKVLKYRMKLPPERRERMILFVVDEAKKNFGIHRDFGVRSTGNISNLALLVSSAREFNMGFFFSDQSVTSLHPILFELCDTFILFKSNAETIHKMGNVMGLTFEQRQWLAERGLEVGQCVVKSGNWPPVLIKVPHFIYEKTVSDEEIRF